AASSALSAAAGGRRRFARRDQRRVAGIERSLHRRRRWIGGRGRQSWRRGLGHQQCRTQQIQPRGETSQLHEGPLTNLWYSGPELAARDGGALRQGTELGPDDVRIHAARSDVNAEAAVDAGRDVVAADEVRVPREALRDELRMLDVVGL